MIKDAIEDSACLERTKSSIDLYLDGWRRLEERKGGVMIEQEDELQKDDLTTAYLTGCYDTRKAYEQRLQSAIDLIEIEGLDEEGRLRIGPDNTDKLIKLLRGE